MRELTLRDVVWVEKFKINIFQEEEEEEEEGLRIYKAKQRMQKRKTSRLSSNCTSKSNSHSWIDNTLIVYTFVKKNYSNYSSKKK